MSRIAGHVLPVGELAVNHDGSRRRGRWRQVQSEGEGGARATANKLTKIKIMLSRIERDSCNEGILLTE
jgi:hypothetical protein